jgi:hypothetical protein
MTEKDELLQPELALGKLGIKTMFTELIQDQTKVFGMLFVILGVY